MTYQIKYRVINSEVAREWHIQEATHIWACDLSSLNGAYRTITDGTFNHSIWTFWIEEQP